MASKKKSAKSIVTNQNKDYTEKEKLQILIDYSEKAISNKGTNIDELFVNQVKRLKKELHALK